jgi:hypothetical protein
VTSAADEVGPNEADDEDALPSAAARAEVDEGEGDRNVVVGECTEGVSGREAPPSDASNAQHSTARPAGPWPPCVGELSAEDMELVEMLQLDPGACVVR